MTRVSRGVQRLGLICAAVLVLLPTVGYGLGLGPLKVTSALNEPLDATIEFTSITNKELQTLEVGLAPVSAFQAVGIPFNQELTGLQFLVEHHPDGRPFLRVTTRQPFPEPYLHILVQAEWAGGRLRREYTALIDPPFLNARKPGGMEAPQASTPSIAENEPSVPPPSEAAGELGPQVSESGSGAGAPQIKVEPVPESEISGSSTSTAPVPSVKSEPLPSTETRLASAPPVTTTQTAPLESAPSIETSESANTGAGEKPQPIGMLPGEYFGPKPATASIHATGWARRKTYRVKRGDTAWEIAQQVRRDRKLSLEQVVLALYDANPRAFFGKNVNNLKAGKILHIPDARVVEKMTRARAHHVFFAQYDEWQEYKMKLARSQHPVKIAAADNRPSSRPVPRKPVETARPIAKHKATRLVHGRHARNGLASKTAKAHSRKVAKVKTTPKTITAKTHKPMGIQLPPTRAARKQELLRIVRANLEKGKQAGKLAESETKAKHQQKLDESVARLNSTAAGKKPKGAANAKEAGTPLPDTRTKSRPVEIANPHLAKVEPGAQKHEAKPVLKPKVRHRPLRVERRPRLPQHRIAPSPQPSLLATAQGILNQILGNQFILMLIGGVVLLALGVGFIYSRRRRQSLTEFEESILTSGDVASGDFSTDSDQVSAGSASDTSFLSDFSQGGLGNISTDEVDPVAEADVYLAYGRDEQAEEILKDAVVKNPDRHELKEKLLEIYAGRSDVAAFETLAEELYASLEGKGGPLWDRVVDMGRKLAPDNPMFSGGAPAAPAAPETPAAGGDETLAIGDTGGALDFGLDEASPAAESGTTGLEFDLGTTPPQGGAAPEAENTSLEMDMDLGLGNESAPAADTQEGEEGLEAVPSSNELDFNFDLSGASEALSEAQPEAPAVPEVPAAEDTGDASGALEFTGFEGFGEEPAAEDSEHEDLALPEVDESGEEDMSDSESLDFEALRKNTPDNNRSSLSLSIDTEMGGLDEDSGDVAVENEISFDGEDMSFDAPSAPVPTTGGISADVDDPSVTVGGSQDQWDEAATKLDLAKAYIDMGDADGARSILEEVAVEGSDDQKRQAAELAAQIA